MSMLVFVPYTYADAVKASNDYIELAVSDNGKFTIGTTNGNPSLSTGNYQDMLYICISSNDGKFANINGMGVSGTMNVNVVPMMIGISVEGYNDIPELIFLHDDKDSYTITPEDENGAIDSTGVMGSYFLGVVSGSAKSAVFSKHGKVSIEGNKGKYELDLSFNEGYGDLPWFAVEVYGDKATRSSLEIAEHGMILKSDNMDYVEVFALNREEEVGLRFGTDKESVNIRAVDNETLGIYIDRDNNGTYETLIVDSKGNEYDVPPDDPSEPPDKPSSPSSEASSELNSNSPSESQPNNANGVSNSDEQSDKSDNSKDLDNSSTDTNKDISSKPQKDSSNTGDSSRPLLMAAILAVVSGIATLFTSKSKKRKNKN